MIVMLRVTLGSKDAAESARVLCRMKAALLEISQQSPCVAMEAVCVSQEEGDFAAVEDALGVQQEPESRFERQAESMFSNRPEEGLFSERINPRLYALVAAHYARGDRLMPSCVPTTNVSVLASAAAVRIIRDGASLLVLEGGWTEYARSFAVSDEGIAAGRVLIPAEFGGIAFGYVAQLFYVLAYLDLLDRLAGSDARVADTAALARFHVVFQHVDVCIAEVEKRYDLLDRLNKVYA